MKRTIERLRAFWRLLVAEHAAPGRLAVAVWLGVIIGCTPFLGLHFFLCMGAAHLLRLNKVAVYAAAHVSIPPLLPLLGSSSVALGMRLRTGHWPTLDLEPFRHPGWAQARQFFFDWLAGGGLIGLLLGAGMGTLIYFVARRNDPWHRLLVEATACFARAPRNLAMYARFKYRLDPCYRAVSSEVPEGSLTVDLGTGLGMLPIVLALLPGERRSIGLEWDPEKLAAARQASAGLPGVQLIAGDMRTEELPECDVMTLIDVLHYHSIEEQNRLFERCARALRPSGRLIVRETAATRGRTTRLFEAWAVRIGWNRGGQRLHYRSMQELCDTVAAIGFTVTVRDLSGPLHPGNFLMVATRRPATSEASLISGAPRHTSGEGRRGDARAAWPRLP